MENKNRSEENIMVSVFMLTYLHGDYIKQAINGVLIQECDFPIELIVADDRSPDNTEEVVNDFLKDHPKKHLVRYTRHEKNKGMHGNFQWMTDQARGKYIAQCEGDDYWTDPHKLQKQVDFLEANPEYGLVYTKARIYEENQQKFWGLDLGKEIKRKDGILYKNHLTSLTTLYRAALNQEYLKGYGHLRKNWAMGDYPKWIWFYYNSKIHFIDEVTAVWRKLEHSASNFAEVKKKMAFKHNTIKVQTYFGKIYLDAPEHIKLVNELLYNYYYAGLVVNPSDSGLYYDEIEEMEGLTFSTKARLFALEKLKVKYLYLGWLKIKKALKGG